jgi:hypothetical protein
MDGHAADLMPLRLHLGRNGPQGRPLGLHGDHLIAEPTGSGLRLRRSPDRRPTWGQSRRRWCGTAPAPGDGHWDVVLTEMTEGRARVAAEDLATPSATTRRRARCPSNAMPRL